MPDITRTSASPAPLSADTQAPMPATPPAEPASLAQRLLAHPAVMTTSSIVVGLGGGVTAGALLRG